MPAADDLHISAVKQKTFLQVNETGTEAAAVTSVMVRVTSAPMHPVVVFDRPFFFAIHDRETDTLLFMGQITDPEDPEWDGG
jgi:serine protease inhibitor